MSRRSAAKPTRKARTYAVAPRKPRGKPAAPRTAKAPGMFQNGGEMLGELAGSMIPVPGASLVGKFLGGKLGHLVSEITGFGDYKINQNSIMDGGMSPPQVVNSINNSGFIIRHREYIGDITSTKTFVNRQFIINPGLSNTFPWLSAMANSFEQYRLRGVLFEFQSTSADSLLSAATSTALGTVAMSTDYDVADEPPTSKRQMLNSMFANSEKPSKTFIHPIECKKSISAQSILYTRGAAVPTGYDQRLYDFARFNIATEGMQSDGGVVGELWVTYEIEFFKQQFNYTALVDHFWMNAISTSRPLGTVLGSNLGRGATIGGLISGDGLSYSFPPVFSNGKYLILYTLAGISSSSSIAPTITTFTNCVQTNFFANGASVANRAPEPAATSLSTEYSTTIIITAQNAAVTFSNSNGGPPASAVVDFWVIRLPDTLTP